MNSQLFWVKCGGWAIVVAVVFAVTPAFLNQSEAVSASTQTATALQERLTLAGRVAKGVRTFGSSDGLELVPCMARTSGFTTIAAGAYLNGDPKNDTEQINALRENAIKGCVTLAILGTNPTANGRSVEQITRDISAFRQSLADKGITNVQVTTSERFEVYRDNPDLANAVDVIFVSLQPFFEGPATGVNVPLTPDQAAGRTKAGYDWLKNRYPNKVVAIGETGWPTAGPDTRATGVNSQTYLRSLLRWSVDRPAPVFIYSLVDEPNLAIHNANLAHFGLSADGKTLKSGFETIFDRSCAVVGTVPSANALQNSATSTCFTGVNFVAPAFPVGVVPPSSCTLSTSNVFSLIRRHAIGISNKDLAKIPINLSGLSGLDTDGDGLPDAIERSLGTAIDKVDTDGDGYSDYTEVMFGYSPLVGGGARMPYDMNFAKQQRGKAFLQVQSKGEAWIVNAAGTSRTYGINTPEAREWACGK